MPSCSWSPFDKQSGVHEGRHDVNEGWSSLWLVVKTNNAAIKGFAIDKL